jgi:PAS domain S-box-containing protein
MNEKTWFENLPAAVTVTDAAGVIVAMNDCAAETFAKYGGKALVGRNLVDVHSPASRDKVAALLRDRQTNTYAIDKAGVRKIIHQTPWFENGEFRGLVEIAFAIPVEMPVQKRD